MDAVRGDFALEFAHRGDQDHVKCSASVTYRAVCNERIVRFSQHSLQQTWSERLRLREGVQIPLLPRHNPHSGRLSSSDFCVRFCKLGNYINDGLSKELKASLGNKASG